MREVFQRLKGKETYSAVMKSLIERHEKLSKLEMGPSPEPDIEEIQRRSDKRYLDQILEMQRGFGSDELALRQFLWTNHKDRYLAIRKVDH
jgi:predicted CopG family antitoxin